MKLTCQCCGFAEEVESPEAAYAAGWDAPPHFSHTCCPLCPAACVVMGASHAKAHTMWAKEGRPIEFSVETCADDSSFGNPAEISKVHAAMAEIERILAKR